MRRTNTRNEPPIYRRSFVCAHPATPVAGDPVLVANDLAGIALSDARNGAIEVDIGSSITRLTIQAVDAQAPNAVVFGDRLYYDPANAPPLNKDATNGVFFSQVLGSIAAGLTTTIPVLHAPPHTESPLGYFVR